MLQALLHLGHRYTRWSLQTYASFSPLAKTLLWALALLHVLALAFVIWVTPDAIFAYFAQLAESLREMQYGWAWLVGALIVASFPPLFGYGTAVTICGFTYGFPGGWYPAALGAILGALLSFLFCRALLGHGPIGRHFSSWLSDARWVALGEAIRSKGLPLILLLRLCPFPPWVYSNLLFASLPSVPLPHFLFATALITPKLLLHVWIGSRIYVLSSPDSRGEMDTLTKALNVLYIVLGVAISLGTGWYVYGLTMKEVTRTLRHDPNSAALADALEEDALLGPASASSSVEHLPLPTTTSSFNRGAAADLESGNATPLKTLASRDEHKDDEEEADAEDGFAAWDDEAEWEGDDADLERRIRDLEGGKGAEAPVQDEREEQRKGKGSRQD